MAYTAIDNPELYFQVKTYTGNGADGNAITFDNTDTSMQPDLVWIKERSTSNESRVYDSVRGVNAALHSTTSGAETQAAAYGQFESFDSNGFTVGQGTGDPGNGAGTNADGATIVAWCWKESATSGFDIVTWTGNATNRTISHSLSAVPKMIIIKERDGTSGWIVYHTALTAEDDYLVLNTTAAEDDSFANLQATAPTTSVFSVGTAQGTNGNTATYVAYAFAEKQGFSKVGLYTGNGNADGPFIYTGFRPAMVILKEFGAAGDNWQIVDNKRKPANPVDALLKPNANTAEQDPSDAKDFLSNGFKIRNSANENNGSTNTFIYIAFAEAPFVNSNGVPANAR
jgi:hypothetical protein